MDKINKTSNKIANDNHEHLINMWRELQVGWRPSGLEFTREFYDEVKANQDEVPSHVLGLIGFHYSWGGKWWGGFARSRYEDHIQRGLNRTYLQLENLEDVKFTNEDYKFYSDVSGAVIYCDPPYRDVTQKSTGYNTQFNHDGFWDWCRVMAKNNVVLVSECHVPSDVEVVWQKKHNSNMSTGKSTKSNEKLVRVL